MMSTKGMSNWTAAVWCTIFILYIASLEKRVEASIQAGGAGYAAFFSGREGSIASTTYTLPKDARGLTFSYWAKPVPMLGGEMNMAAVSLSSMRADRSLNELFGISNPTSSRFALIGSANSFRIKAHCKDAVVCPPEGALEAEWTHYTLTWNATTGLVAAYINGAPATVEASGNSGNTIVRLFSMNQDPRKVDCTTTTGGYVPEDAECVFPFRYNGKIHRTCAPWSARPYTGGSGPRKTRNLGFDRTLRWCATVANYKSDQSETQRKWGFCSCEDPERVPFDRDELVVNNATRSWFSGPIPSKSFEKERVMTLDCSQAIGGNSTSSLEGQVVVVTLKEECDAWLVAKRLDSQGAEVILFILEDAQSLSLPSTSSAVGYYPQVKVVEDAAAQVAWIDKSIPYLKDQKRCSSMSPASDLNIDTVGAVSSCAFEVQMASHGPPFPSHYSFVVPRNVNMQNWKWRVFARGSAQSKWRIIDRRSGEVLRDAAQVGNVRQYFFAMAYPMQPTVDALLQYRVEFFTSNSSLSSCASMNYKLAEFGLFSSVNLAIPGMFSSGNLTALSYYNQRFVQGRVVNISNANENSLVNALVLGVDASNTALISRLGRVDMEFYHSLRANPASSSPFTSGDEAGIGQGELSLVVGQSPLGPALVDSSRAFTGLLEDVRIYPYQITKMQALSLYEDGGYFESQRDAEQETLPNLDLPAGSSNGSLFSLDLPYTMFPFDQVEGGFDLGRSQQDLQFGKALSWIDRFKLRSEKDPSVDVKGPLRFVPSDLERSLGGPVVEIVEGSSKTIPLLVKNYRAGSMALEVTISTDPKFGTLSKVQLINDGLDQPLVGTVTYTKKPNQAANWNGDSFTYKIKAKSSALTATGTVVLIKPVPVEPQPALQTFHVDSQGEVTFAIGGDFDMNGQPLTVNLNTTSIKSGRVSPASSCGDENVLSSTATATNAMTSFAGLMMLKYIAPNLVESEEMVEVLRWTYQAGSTLTKPVAEIRFVVRRPVPVLPNQFKLVNQSEVESSLVRDGQALIIPFEGPIRSPQDTRIGFQIFQNVRFGRLFGYSGPLSPGVVNASSIRLQDLSRQLAIANDTQLIRRIGAFQVLRASSRFVESAIDMCSASVDSASPQQRCDRWSDDDNCCTSPNSDNRYALNRVLGDPDGRGMRFASQRSGHEFIELKFPVKLVVQSVIIRQRRTGSGGTLIRVSSARAGSFKPFNNACGGRDHSRLTSNFSTSPLECLLPTTDCETDWEGMWDIGYTRNPCLQDPRVQQEMIPGDLSWVDTEIPFSSLGDMVDVIRLDFDTRNTFDWVEIDSVMLVGYAPLNTAVVNPQTIWTRLSSNSTSLLKLAYFPAPGVTGEEKFVYRTAAQSSVASETMSVRFNVLSTAFFGARAVIGVSPEGGVFNFDFPMDISGPLDALAKSVYGAESSTQLRQLWPPTAFMDSYLAFPALTYSPGRSTYAFEQKKNGLGMNSSSILFQRSNLNASVLVGGDVPMLAVLNVSGYSDEDPSAMASFTLAFSLSGACGQASDELGACSARGRPYLNGECVSVDGRYRCQCKQTADILNDIVVAGEFCQYDSFSTCFGRGYPDNRGVCTCFEPDLFGADHCNKRKFNTSVDQIKEELSETARRFTLALSVLGIEDVEVLEINSGANLVLRGVYDADPVDLITVNLADELNPDNNCHGNGEPLKGPLSTAECNCDEGWFPKKSCRAKLVCAFGEYKDGEEELAQCRPCPRGYACDGLDRKLCTNGTFNLQPRSSQCFQTCTEAGVLNAYLNWTSETEASCLPCDIGNYCDGRESRKCPAGTFWTRQQVCIECNNLGLFYYNSEPGALTCQKCPEDSSRIEGSPGLSINECVCLPGKWNANPKNVSLTGVPCADCPENADCDGFEVLQLLVNNHQRQLQTMNSNSSNPQNITQYRNSRPYPQEGFWGDPENPSVFFACPDECLGGKNFSCVEGYRGRLCQQCSPGYHDINGFCYQCPDEDNSNALVVFGIAGIVIAFIIINRASTEVQALDIALLYTQVANLVQQFSFYFPPPVSELETYYSVTDFDIDFITADCVRRDTPWTFTDSFFAQWFLVWYIGAAYLFINLCAFGYSRFREYRKKQQQAMEKQVDLHAQRRRAARAAARQAVLRLEMKRKQTGEIDFDAHEGQAGQADPLASNSSTNNQALSDPMSGNSEEVSPTSSPRQMFSDQALMFSESTRDDISRRDNRKSKNKCEACVAWFRSKLPARCMRNKTQGSGSHLNLRFDDEDKTDPRFRAVARWVRRTLGFPKDYDDYKTYSNGQLAGWINLVRIVYNSVLIVCLESFFCISLADGTSVLRAYPDLQCGTAEHSVLVAFGALGMVIYGLGLPAFVYLILTYGATHNKKADKPFYERFGFLYIGYRQSHYRWELLVLLRRLAMCMILVCADGQPYIQAIFGGTVIVGCLAAQLYHRPYLSDRINVLENIALGSIFFYLLCGLVFTGLNDLYYSKQSSLGVQSFIADFSNILSYILLIVSLLTIAVCFLVFLQDLRDFFNVLVTERSLFRKAKSEDVALLRVIRADELKVPKADRDLGKQFLDMATGKKPKPTTPVPKDALKLQKGRRRRSSLNISLGALAGRNAKQPHTLFSFIDKDGNNTISREELMQYAKDELGIDDNEENRARIDRIFRMYDVDVSGSVDVREFMDMVRSEMPAADECELKNTIKPKYLIKWAASNKVNPLSVALFFELDKNMRAAVADDSVVSAYRDTSKAKFYRAIAEAFPFLADWLASAQQEDVKAFGKILEELNECRDMVGSRGTFSRITVEIDRAPVVWWLVGASEEERSTFRSVFGSICEASSKNGTEFPIWRRIKSGSSVRDAQKDRSRRRPRKMNVGTANNNFGAGGGASPLIFSTRDRSSQTPPSPSSSTPKYEGDDLAIEDDGEQQRTVFSKNMKKSGRMLNSNEDGDPATDDDEEAGFERPYNREAKSETNNNDVDQMESKMDANQQQQKKHAGGSGRLTTVSRQLTAEEILGNSVPTVHSFQFNDLYVDDDDNDDEGVEQIARLNNTSNEAGQSSKVVEPSSSLGRMDDVPQEQANIAQQQRAEGEVMNNKLNLV